MKSLKREKREEKKKRRQVQEGREEGDRREVRDVMRCLGKGWREEMKRKEERKRIGTRSMIRMRE